jgi:hypothetical protein
MSGELFKERRGNFGQVDRDNRIPGGRFHEMRLYRVFLPVPVLAGFSVADAERLSRNNMGTIFGVSEIPADTQIQSVMDRTELELLFDAALRTAGEAGLLEGYGVLDGGGSSPGPQWPTEFTYKRTEAEVYSEWVKTANSTTVEFYVQEGTAMVGGWYNGDGRASTKFVSIDASFRCFAKKPLFPSLDSLGVCSVQYSSSAPASSSVIRAI